MLNRIMEQYASTPKVGEGATLLMWSDRHPATVTRVSPSGKTAWIKEDNAKRTDSNGMSESQTYEYTPNPSAPEQKVTLTKKGWRIPNGPRVLFGVREKYHDFSF